MWAWVVVYLYVSALWLTGDLSRVYSAPHSMPAGISSSPQQPSVDKQYIKWNNGWILHMKNGLKFQKRGVRSLWLSTLLEVIKVKGCSTKYWLDITDIVLLMGCFVENASLVLLVSSKSWVSKLTQICIIKLSVTAYRGPRWHVFIMFVFTSLEYLAG